MITTYKESQLSKFIRGTQEHNDCMLLLNTADRIANLAAMEINRAALHIKTPTMPYKSQAILEHLIGILQEKV